MKDTPEVSTPKNINIHTFKPKIHTQVQPEIHESVPEVPPEFSSFVRTLQFLKTAFNTLGGQGETGAFLLWSNTFMSEAMGQKISGLALTAENILHHLKEQNDLLRAILATKGNPLALTAENILHHLKEQNDLLRAILATKGNPHGTEQQSSDHMGQTPDTASASTAEESK